LSDFERRLSTPANFKVNFAIKLNKELGCYHLATCHVWSVVEHPKAFGRYVRLNLIGEIAEVVSFDTTEITIKYKGNTLTMDHYEVSRISHEEEVLAASRIAG
jgi:hypothetical protein